MTRILIVDDHELIRMAIQQFLANQPDLEVVGTATDGATAIRLSTELKPDVILMDLAMPEVDGVEATRQITALLPDTRVLVLTSFSDRERILDAIDAGAVGYLLKDAAPDELLSGIRAAARDTPPSLSQRVQAPVVIALQTQLSRRTLFGDPTVNDHGHCVRHLSGRETVSNDDHRAVLDMQRQRIHDEGFRLVVHRGRWFVHYQDRRIPEQRPYNGDPLALTTGQRHAPLADLRVIRLR